MKLVNLKCPKCRNVLYTYESFDLHKCFYCGHNFEKKIGEVEKELSKKEKEEIKQAINDVLRRDGLIK